RQFYRHGARHAAAVDRLFAAAAAVPADVQRPLHVRFALLSAQERAMTGSQDIDAKISSLGDWRGALLTRLRKLIHDADPQVIEEVKWRKASNPLGVPTWSHDGIICTGETYRDKIKLTFARGASIDDPAGLFNSSLDGGTRRAIDIREGETIDGPALTALIRRAVEFNRSA